MERKRGYVSMVKKMMCSMAVLVVTVLLSAQAMSQTTPEGTAWVSYRGSDGCVELSNGTTRVVLEPNVGGRVVEYSLNGQNSLYQSPEKPAEGVRGERPDAGRFDIGPEMTSPPRPQLWQGKWKAEIIGPGAARLTSEKDTSSGIQLIREFRLDRNSSHLSCIQTIINISDSTKRYNHWSRTLAVGGGICIVPLTPDSRFPLGYIYYGPGSVLNYRHEKTPNIRVRNGFLEILGTPPEPKFGIDSYAGWLGYITPSNLLFVKKFPVYPDRVYGEVAAYTISLWYYKNEMCELEPIGPRETLKPGERASFTEDWWLLPYEFPQGKDVDLAAFEGYIQKNTRK